MDLTVTFPAEPSIEPRALDMPGRRPGTEVDPQHLFFFKDSPGWPSVCCPLASTSGVLTWQAWATITVLILNYQLQKTKP